jgi:magnesium chelatase family protein
MKLLPFPATQSQKMCYCVHPCPCGWFNSPTKPCTCSSATVTKYQKRISGLLMDRIDIHIQVPTVDYEKLTDKRMGESSKTVRERVEGARERQSNEDRHATG